ncbi:MAG: diacylglycerol kinase family protein [Nanoarchaeota archaeon]
MRTINVIATSMSGSVKDWKKLDLLESTFKKYTTTKVNIFIVDTHQEARKKANELVSKGARIIVSAGGAGTFNSVLEGCRQKKGFPPKLRLAFLRKGSADLIGKTLGMSDDLDECVQSICMSLKKDKIVLSDVIRCETNNQQSHFIGFAGLGIFGIVPHFTENRFIKNYKGILGWFFGDRGPFFVGAQLALLKYYMSRTLRRRNCSLSTGKKKFSPVRYANIIILNGDLGKDFPLAKGIPLESNSFKVVLFPNLGMINTYHQFSSSWKGKTDEMKKRGIHSVVTNKLIIEPDDKDETMINIDGLLLKGKGRIMFSVTDKVALIKA